MDSGISIRKFPYPYRAALAICSDLDLTPDRQVFIETMKYLNTTEQTIMGHGLGLEVGNSIYFDMPRSQFSYWNTDDEGRELLRALIKTGHVDCLHSFGDFATSRDHAEKALEELERHGCYLRIWVDHGIAPSNFGRDIMKGKGDIPGSPTYHADLTIEYGVRYIWVGRVTSVVGQDIPRRLGGIFVSNHPFLSVKTLAKEGVKVLIAETIGGKYAMHAHNEILRKVTLRDGQATLEFIRCNPHWGGVSSYDTADGIGGVLTQKVFDLLEDRGGVCILYTHLGKICNREKPFCGETVEGLDRLARRVREGRILLTTTRRLLDYTRAWRTSQYSTIQEGDWTHLFIEAPPGGEACGYEKDAPEGMTFYVPDPEKTRVFFDGQEVPVLHRNPADATGRRSVSIPWNKLRFPLI